MGDTSEGVGGNPLGARSDGERAEELANAMAGLSDTFEDIMTETRNAAGEHVRSGYSTFFSEHEDTIRKVQEHGMDLANNIQAGASEIALTDQEITDDYQGAWPGLSRNININ